MRDEQLINALADAKVGDPFFIERRSWGGSGSILYRAKVVKVIATEVTLQYQRNTKQRVRKKDAYAIGTKDSRWSMYIYVPTAELDAKYELQNLQLRAQNLASSIKLSDDKDALKTLIVELEKHQPEVK